MSVTATGQFALLVDTLAAMLSAATTWQKITQSANAAAALAKILVFGKDSSEARPHAVVYLTDGGGNNIGGGSVEAFLPSSKIVMALEIPIEYAGTVTTATSATAFKASALAAFADDTFNQLELTITPTGGAQETKAISDFTGSDGTLTLASALAIAPSVGDTFTIQAANARDAEVWFLNLVSAILADIKALAGTGGYFSISQYRLADYGSPPREKEEPSYSLAVVELTKGDAGA